MTRRLFLAAPCALTLAMLPACGPPPVGGPELVAPTSADSASYPTSELSPSFSAQDYGDGTGLHVYAALLSPSDAFVQLTGGDSLFATVGSEILPLTIEQSDAGTVHYTATFASSTGPSSPVSIALDRPILGGSATASSTVVPGPFSEQGPTSVTIGQTLTIPLTPAAAALAQGTGESWELDVSAGCIGEVIASTADGTLQIDANGALVLDTSTLGFDATSGGGSCTASILVRHEHYGPDDPTLSAPVADDSVILDNAPSGQTWSFEGVQVRSYTVQLVAP